MPMAVSASTPDDDKQRKPMNPAVRRRLQLQFEQGSKVAAQGNFDYATDMFLACVKGDPGNSIYVQNYLGNLRRKYNNNKKGDKFAAVKMTGTKGALKKASMQKNYAAMIENGVELLQLNPWDTSTLKTLAEACEQLELDKAQLDYLNAALEVDISDAEINRLAGRAKARQGMFQDATVCFTRVLKSLPADIEAKKALADLAVLSTIERGRYETAESSQDVRVDAQDAEATGPTVTPEKQFEKAIAKNPADTSNYLKLAEHYAGQNRLEEAEQTLARALEASGGEVNIRERLEDMQLRRLRENVGVAEKRFRSEKTEEAKTLYGKFRGELLQRELEIYAARAERYPTNLGFKYEVGTRLKKVGKPREAIPYLQDVQKDSRRKGEVLLLLGECFQSLKPPQAKLAMNNYVAAVDTISDMDADLKKLALYRTGALALALKDLDRAESYLTTLAGMDFAYKDVSTLLDKIAELRDNP
ncbi:MAG: tetratricopeptide repeat protein [Pirellulales bacterium]|nr:tetratricopeptide repeat protein [Pirellulales bacterium]